jgi:hypothetical protein
VDRVQAVDNRDLHAFGHEHGLQVGQERDPLGRVERRAHAAASTACVSVPQRYRQGPGGAYLVGELRNEPT